ncbi:MAG: sulfur carrier protein ThiS [Thermoguttaceae bacterium]|nr:sulfur carrier protein ThiS [Thermoguttaceae bacterium]
MGGAPQGVPLSFCQRDGIVQICLNGKSYDLPSDASVAMLLDQLGVGGKHVAVEVNTSLVPKRNHAEHPLADGDVVEVVTLVGGG